MKTRQQTLLELKQLNEKLDQITNQNRYFIYSTSPFKFAIYNFIAGIFHSLGTLFGTIFVTAALIYVLSQLRIDLVSPTTKFLEDTFSRIDWNKIIPAPKIDYNQFRLQ
ncbi:DUF5665 domain-containing protein [Patescibacteria group bacterium]|nr:DUF5665 domain-containing protein [Patescibacteria group bacterium]